MAARLTKFLAIPYLLLLSCILRPRCCASQCQRCGRCIDAAAFPAFVSDETRRRARVCADCALALLWEAIQKDDDLCECGAWHDFDTPHESWCPAVARCFTCSASVSSPDNICARCWELAQGAVVDWGHPAAHDRSIGICQACGQDAVED